MAPAEVKAKSGTSVIKSAPPKETARITVKPSLPGATKSPGTNLPGGKIAAPGATAVAAAAGAAAGAAAVKAGEPTPKVVATTPGTSMAFEEEKSTLWTTVAAGALAVLTWSTAALLCYSLLS
jgi:hypothetical protein